MGHWNNLSLSNIVEYIEGIGWVTEQWHPVGGYEGMYQVSTFGRVKSLIRTIRHYRGKYKSREKIRRLSFSKQGYCRVTLSKNDKAKIYFVHVLLAKAVHLNPDNKPQVNHIDTDKGNNIYLNLEWVTRSENMQHAVANGCMNPPKGELAKSAKLKNDQVLEIFNSKLSTKELSCLYNISEKNIGQIKRGTRWKHLTNKIHVKQVPMSQEVRDLIFKETGPQKDVMKKFGISRSLLYKIKSGRSWADIDKGSKR